MTGNVRPMPPGGTVTLSPLLDPDLTDVGDFLHRELNPRLTAGQWAAAIAPTWQVEAPNHGFVLRDDEQIVGVYVAIYSERVIDGDVEKFCNLAAWCVLESHRGHGVRLLRAVLGQKGFHFVDLSPSGNVIELNRRLGFVDLDTTTYLVACAPWARSRGARLHTGRDVEQVLAGEDLRRYLEHRTASAAIQLAIQSPDGRVCHVVVRKDRRKGLPLFASVLHVSDREVFGRHQALVYRHLAVRYQVGVALVEPRVVGEVPRLARRLRTPRPKMYRSPTLRDSDIDYLYSELTCVPW